MVKINLYPFAAATKERPIPVLPLVGSIITESSLSNPVSSIKDRIAVNLIETAEKGAEIYLKIKPFEIKQEISDENLKEIAKWFNVSYKDGWVD